MTNTVVSDAQNKLVDDVVLAIEAFLTSYEGVTLDSLHYDRYPAEGGSNVRCSVSYTDTDGARVTRSV